MLVRKIPVIHEKKSELLNIIGWTYSIVYYHHTYLIGNHPDFMITSHFLQYSYPLNIIGKISSIQTINSAILYVRRVRRYQRHHNPFIEEEQTTQWPKQKGQKNKERSTKHTYKTEDRVRRNYWNFGPIKLV